MTPVLHPDGTVPYDKFMRQFAERAENRDRELTMLVLRKLSGSRRSAYLNLLAVFLTMVMMSLVRGRSDDGDDVMTPPVSCLFRWIDEPKNSC
jgi:hypothetical protein